MIPKLFSSASFSLTLAYINIHSYHVLLFSSILLSFLNGFVCGAWVEHVCVWRAASCKWKASTDINWIGKSHSSIRLSPGGLIRTRSNTSRVKKSKRPFFFLPSFSIRGSGIYYGFWGPNWRKQLVLSFFRTHFSLFSLLNCWPEQQTWTCTHKHSFS